jgi:hypothetical protein
MYLCGLANASMSLPLAINRNVRSVLQGSNEYWHVLKMREK